MTAAFRVDLVDQLDAEHQRLVMTRLHFNQHIMTLSRQFQAHQDKYGHKPVPVLETGPQPNEQRKIVCGTCGHWLDWLPKLKNATRRAPSSTGLADSDFCQCCRKTGVNLVGHHVIEVSEGGSNEPDNLWTVCEPCHQVIHALRRHALGPFESVGEAQRRIGSGQ